MGWLAAGGVVANVCGGILRSGTLLALSAVLPGLAGWFDKPATSRVLSGVVLGLEGRWVRRASVEWDAVLRSADCRGAAAVGAEWGMMAVVVEFCVAFFATALSSGVFCAGLFAGFCAMLFAGAGGVWWIRPYQAIKPRPSKRMMAAATLHTGGTIFFLFC